MPSRISQMRSNQLPQQWNQDLVNEFKQVMKSGNAEQYLSNIFSSNPKLQPIFSIMKDENKLKSLAMAMAQQTGTDLDALIKELSNI